MAPAASSPGYDWAIFRKDYVKAGLLEEQWDQAKER